MDKPRKIIIAIIRIIIICSGIFIMISATMKKDVLDILIGFCFVIIGGLYFIGKDNNN